MTSRADADGLLARIVAGITIPASELGVPPVPGRAAPGESGAASLDEAAARAERNPIVAERRQRIAAAAPAATRATRLAEEIASAGESRGGKAAGRSKSDDRDTATSRTRNGAAVDDEEEDTGKSGRRSAAADARLAAKKKAAEELAEEKKAARANAARIWVQVAGGANEDDLGKAWAAARAKAPALASRAAYTTPLRATNRVVTGPFKTEAEARAMVNTLAKQGLFAFTFTSAAGQKMTRLETKAK